MILETRWKCQLFAICTALVGPTDEIGHGRTLKSYIRQIQGHDEYQLTKDARKRQLLSPYQIHRLPKDSDGRQMVRSLRRRVSGIGWMWSTKKAGSSSRRPAMMSWWSQSRQGNLGGRKW